LGYLCGMGRLRRFHSAALVAISLALVATACNTRPTTDAFDSTTTSVTTLATGEVATTTTPTLPPPEERITATVISITDGDTIGVLLNGTEVTLRLLGINAPELDECWGPEASSALAGLVEGSTVTLVAGEDDVDQFGRILRYVFIDAPKGPLLVNSAMVEQGNALGMSGGHEFAVPFKALEARAVQSGRGMWGTLVCGDSDGIAADRPVVRVSEVSYDPAGPDDEVLEQETVTITNEGYGRVSLSGWVLRDESSTNRFTFPTNTVLAPGDSIIIVTACSGGPDGSLHWCSDTPVWNNDGDTVIVSDTLGNAVIWHAYSPTDGTS